MNNILIEGDALEPCSTDIIVQSCNRRISDGTPPGEGWRIMTGNTTHNSWYRVVYRSEALDALSIGSKLDIKV